MDPTTERQIAFCPVSRSKALTRGVLWGAAAVLLSVITTVIYRPLDFAPAGLSNRLVDVSIALVALPLPILAAGAAVQTLRCILLSIWPGRIGIFAAARTLTLRLGPLGTRRFDAKRLELRYPFELSADEDDAGFEAFLPQEQQRQRLLPRILHPGSREPLQRTILRMTAGQEADVARALRPAFDHWRGEQASSLGPLPKPRDAETLSDAGRIE